MYSMKIFILILKFYFYTFSLFSLHFYSSTTPSWENNSGSADSPYQAQTDSTNSSTPHPNGFVSRSPQTEPVDFSGPRTMGFGLIGPPAPYSRESTPDSGGSHYIDNFRDPSGK
jgi:hypothetical protein